MLICNKLSFNSMVLKSDTCDKFIANMFKMDICANCQKGKDLHYTSSSHPVIKESLHKACSNFSPNLFKSDICTNCQQSEKFHKNDLNKQNAKKEISLISKEISSTKETNAISKECLISKKDIINRFNAQQEVNPVVTQSNCSSKWDQHTFTYSKKSTEINNSNKKSLVKSPISSDIVHTKQHKGKVSGIISNKNIAQLKDHTQVDSKVVSNTALKVCTEYVAHAFKENICRNCKNSLEKHQKSHNSFKLIENSRQISLEDMEPSPIMPIVKDGLDSQCVSSNISIPITNSSPDVILELDNETCSDSNDIIISLDSSDKSPIISLSSVSYSSIE